MNDIRQQIESVYIRHTAWITDGGFITCVCGRDNLLITEHAKHVAEILVSELGLTEFVCDGERWWSTKLEPVDR